MTSSLPGSSLPLSGTPYELAADGYTAVVASVGAAVRVLRHEGRDLVVPFGADEARPDYRGVILGPWPNRIADGRYSFGGARHQLPLTEPERGNALHGFTAQQDFEPVAATPTSVTLRTVIQAQPGYPFRIAVTVEHALSDAGLVTTVTAQNTGPDAAPWGTGPHPYLVAGPGLVDEWELTLPASAVLAVTPDRLLPTAVVGADELGFDFAQARAIGASVIDHAFTELARDARGLTTVQLRAPGGTGVGMSWDARCPWVQLHTSDRPDAARNRIGLAVEPMTCPPDAFNSGVDLITLQPGESAAAAWSIFAL